MSTVMETPNTKQLATASALQKLLPELVALSMDAKQAHWNIVGEHFLTIHPFMDQLAADVRAWTDRIAERAVALGFAVDARPGTVASTAHNLPAGRLGAAEAVREIATTLHDVIATARLSLAELDHSDPVAHDVLVTTLEGLEKYRWMLRAQEARR